MNLPLVSGRPTGLSRALPALVLSLVAALGACGCIEGSGGSSSTGGSGAGEGSATGGSGGSGGSTVTETHGCPASEPPPNTPCYDKGLRCDLGIPTHCSQHGHSLDCYSWSDDWQLTEWDTSSCECPEALPAEGDPCDPMVMAEHCKFTVAADCGDVEIEATCTAYQGEDKGWSVPTPTCS